MNEHNQTLEANRLNKVRQIAQNDGYDLRVHIGGSSNPSCALVPKNIGKTYVFPNLEQLVAHLFQSEKTRAEFESLTSIDLEKAPAA